MKCPACRGAVTYIGANDIECVTHGCQWGPRGRSEAVVLAELRTTLIAAWGGFDKFDVIVTRQIVDGIAVPCIGCVFGSVDAVSVGRVVREAWRAAEQELCGKARFFP